MIKIPCPSCAGELTFRSNTSVFAVCPYCTSTVVRHDLDLEKIGEMGALAEDSSPIQVGMTGSYKNKFFYTSGRIIYEYEDGLWNEWHLYFDTGETGWLTDAQGEFAISFPSDEPIPSRDDLKIGKGIKLENDYFKVSDIKRVTYKGSEGELPFKATKDYRSFVYDFSHDDNKFLTIEIPEERGLSPMMYKGSYIDFWKLTPQNIRLIEGWI
ncbi:MAG: DUF4178 domain-containing protein [Bacteriovoracaceae bacterium]|nr:DUF4178 domain-containing protein [Bacteriovoracaceae bacterium]